MSQHKFEYPATGTPTNTLTWDTKARLIDDQTQLQLNDVDLLTIGGTSYTRELGDNHYYFPFSAIVPKSSSTATDEADVFAFFAVVKRLYPFKWTDENGTVRTVKNKTNPITSENFSGTHRKFSILLREE